MVVFATFTYCNLFLNISTKIKLKTPFCDPGKTKILSVEHRCLTGAKLGNKRFSAFRVCTHFETVVPSTGGFMRKVKKVVMVYLSILMGLNMKVRENAFKTSAALQLGYFKDGAYYCAICY